MIGVGGGREIFAFVKNVEPPGLRNDTRPISFIEWRQSVGVVRGVEEEGESDLAGVVFAVDGFSAVLCAAQSGQEHGSENGNDGDHHEELDQSERPGSNAARAAWCGLKIRSHCPVSLDRL